MIFRADNFDENDDSIGIIAIDVFSISSYLCIFLHARQLFSKILEVRFQISYTLSSIFNVVGQNESNGFVMSSHLTVVAGAPLVLRDGFHRNVLDRDGNGDTVRSRCFG